jgi:hypothetical protein
MSMSTPSTVTVTAPSTLEEGFTFEAVADGMVFTGEFVRYPVDDLRWPCV